MFCLVSFSLFASVSRNGSNDESKCLNFNNE